MAITKLIVGLNDEAIKPFTNLDATVSESIRGLTNGIGEMPTMGNNFDGAFSRLEDSIVGLKDTHLDLGSKCPAY